MTGLHEAAISSTGYDQRRWNRTFTCGGNKLAVSCFNSPALKHNPICIDGKCIRSATPLHDQIDEIAAIPMSSKLCTIGFVSNAPL